MKIMNPSFAAAVVIFLSIITFSCSPTKKKNNSVTDNTNYVGFVDPYIMSARGQFFFFGTGKRPSGMVNVFPDTKNAGRNDAGYKFTSSEVVGFCLLQRIDMGLLGKGWKQGCRIRPSRTRELGWHGSGRPASLPVNGRWPVDMHGNSRVMMEQEKKWKNSAKHYHR